MALTKGQIKKDYPLPVYNYRVEIDGAALSFSEVTGLSISYETTTYKEIPTESGAAGPRVMHMPAEGSPVKVTLQKGIVKAKSLPALYNWISATQINQDDKKDIYVRLCDEAGAPVISWKVINAFPTKLDAPSFTADTNDAAIETMELMGDGISMEEA